MGYPIKKEDKKYTYADYLTWPDEERWELIEGSAYDMSPSPSRKHQEISIELSRQISNFLKDKPCKVYAAPFDVRLPEKYEKEEDIINVVQPDIVVVCDKKKLDDKGCIGTPDLIIEIISPSTASIDYIIKSRLYERNQVKEYWIVQPTDGIVMVYKLTENSKFTRPEIYSKEDQIKVGIFSDELVVDLKDVFRE